MDNSTDLTFENIEPRKATESRLISLFKKNVENKFKGIFINELLASRKTQIEIRNTHKLFEYFPVLVVQCECGTAYKKELKSYNEPNLMSSQEEFICPNELCGRSLEIRYSKIKNKY